MEQNKQAKPGAGRWKLLAVLAVCAAPLVLSYLMYYVVKPEGRTNYGELVTPAKPLPSLQFLDAAGKPTDSEALKGRWSLVYMGAADCGKTCMDKLFQIRQVRILLNDERVRVRRYYVAPDSAALQIAQARLADTHKDLSYLADIGQPGSRAVDFFHPTDPDAVYLIDPLGNWMMIYPGTAEYKGMLKDIKYLLKLSHIG